MTRKAHGIVRKNTVVLDEPVPEMEGCHVELEIRMADPPEEEAPSEAELQTAWNIWVSASDQGPIAGEPDAWT